MCSWHFLDILSYADLQSWCACKTVLSINVLWLWELNPICLGAGVFVLCGVALANSRTELGYANLVTLIEARWRSLMSAWQHLCDDTGQQPLLLAKAIPAWSLKCHIGNTVRTDSVQIVCHIVAVWNTDRKRMCYQNMDDKEGKSSMDAKASDSKAG